MVNIKKLYSVSESPSVYIADLARLLETRGNRLIKLQTGDPDFDVHPDIINAISNSLHKKETHYSHSAGLPELRSCIALKYSHDLTESNIIITHGAVHAIFLSITALVNQGDHVLIPEPNWATYDNIVKIAGGIPVKIDTRDNAFLLDIDNLERYWTRQCTLLILNSPCNPSGKILSRERLLSIYEWCKKKNISIVADEVYNAFIYKKINCRYCSFYEIIDDHENIVIINSFSKTYSMTGLRIGYLLTSEQVAKQILKVQQATATNIAVPVQRGAIAALNSNAVHDYVLKMVNTFKERKVTIQKKLDSLGLDYLEPDGAFYFLIKIPENKIKNFCIQLLNDKNVVVVPGAAYGDSIKNYIRIAFCGPLDDIMLGITKIGELINKKG